MTSKLLLSVLLPLVATAAFAANPEYIIFEGGGPDQGPGLDNHDANRAAMLREFGPADPTSPRMVAYGIQQIRILTRSAASIAANEVEPALDAAEATGLPVWLHIDPIYGWGSDGEKRAEDAPPVKFWEHPAMREWSEFPVGDKLPEYIPRIWFNWGPWCSPAPAFPAIGSPKLVEFARTQLREGVLKPLAARLERWEAEGRSYLFAGLNIGWEVYIPHYRRDWLPFRVHKPATVKTTHYPHEEGLRMDPKLVGMQLGYASLHWQGWNEERLQAAAEKEGISRDQKFEQLSYKAIHDYMEALAKEAHDAGIGREKVYTHIIALSTLHPADTWQPPVWTAVNPYSTPGFTMDNKGGAKYDLAKLKKEIAEAPGSRGAVFGNVETYLKLGGANRVQDAASYQRELEQLFADGATVQVLFGSFPFGPKTPTEGLKAIKAWAKGKTPDAASKPE